jgi:class 3 adenylate cyclase
MTQRNEALTLEVLHEHRRLLRELFPKFEGREIETTGDGFLVEFESAVEAVRGKANVFHGGAVGQVFQVGAGRGVANLARDDQNRGGGN